ncbi:phosphoadenylyl-sulfate reductase [Pseudohongiella sp.]|uniref:Adenosine 5'-phosphosulfate reductase n=1 Tax=marine sediment metagenome TaxID=412755 RepID=A0A0F9Z0L1_9ZZZZ|nr:phosphoadenylyl-sulfate reductase [Pseudohongiella sp.]HDZ09831.1 phosphoadenylyl-sulfate reductase [Pseudohongiella sp.]HEA61555.1 phosphoadenylyl-sulfate reductase [Pseudohongiella sp.]
MISAQNIVEINEQFNRMEPKEILQQVLADIPNVVVSFSGAEDVALVVMAWKLKKNIKVFTLDTGRLHAQTYQFIDRVRQDYGLDLDFLYPDTAAIQALTGRKGLFSFYQDGHEECCSIRKTEPLRRQLATVDAWITGQRKDQSPTRTDVALAQVDSTFAAPGKTLLKFNPFANWRSKDVWDYIRMFDLPYNPLHDQGYVSIGCEPCTKPIGPNQHEREGRWWWEEATAKECGLHKINIIE